MKGHVSVWPSARKRFAPPEFVREKFASPAEVNGHVTRINCLIKWK